MKNMERLMSISYELSRGDSRRRAASVRKPHLFARGVLVLIVSMLIVSPSTADVLCRIDFETGDLSQTHSIHKDKDAQLQVAENPSGSGWVMKSSISSKEERAEIRVHRDPVPSERWYGWSLFLPKGYTEVKGKSDILFQWHRGGGAPSWARGHPMCFMINSEGRYQLIWTFQKSIGNPTSRVNESQDLRIGYIADRDKWVHWALHAKWSIADDGYLGVYRNGKLVWQRRGANWLNWGPGPMVKAGIYTGDPGWSGNNPTLVYHDNIIVGDADSEIREVCPALTATETAENQVSSGRMQKLRVGPNKRFLVKEDGSAFVWIGATMWKWRALGSRQIKQIIDDHSRRGYTLLQVIAYPDSYDRVDEMVRYAQTKNMYMGLLTGWYRDVLKGTEDELYQRGRTLGARYRDDNNIIWLTAGEAGGHNRKGTIPDNKLEALVRGIRDGDTGDKLLTVHADYKRGTSIDNDTRIVDFDNWQTSQWGSPVDLPRNDPRQWTVWQAISHDYNRKPIKPTLDSEAWYENNKDHFGATPFAIRRRAYYTILAGGLGHTYGAGGIWDGLIEPQGRSGDWEEALKYEGYIQIGYLSEFLHSFGNDLLKLRPDQSIIVDGNSDSYDEHIEASVADDGGFALVYSADDSSYRLDLTRLRAESVLAKWYNPRENIYSDDVNSPYSCTNSSQTFDPPGRVGPGNDWVLILGNVARSDTKPVRL